MIVFFKKMSFEELKRFNNDLKIKIISYFLDNILLENIKDKLYYPLLINKEIYDIFKDRYLFLSNSIIIKTDKFLILFKRILVCIVNLSLKLDYKETTRLFNDIHYTIKTFHYVDVMEVFVELYYLTDNGNFIIYEKINKSVRYVLKKDNYLEGEIFIYQNNNLIIRTNIKDIYNC